MGILSYVPEVKKTSFRITLTFVKNIITKNPDLEHHLAQQLNMLFNPYLLMEFAVLQMSM